METVVPEEAGERVVAWTHLVASCVSMGSVVVMVAQGRRVEAALVERYVISGLQP